MAQLLPALLKASRTSASRSRQTAENPLAAGQDEHDEERHEKRTPTSIFIC